jgi:hypothetical protein
LLKQAIEARGKEWPPGLADVLGQHIATPSDQLRLPLIALCKQVATSDEPDREKQSLVFRCLASVAGEEDVGWLSDIVASSPFFDVRANAGAALGAIGGPQAAAAIGRSIERETFYFVRHSLEASKRRAAPP